MVAALLKALVFASVVSGISIAMEDPKKEAIPFGSAVPAAINFDSTRAQLGTFDSSAPMAAFDVINTRGLVFGRVRSVTVVDVPYYTGFCFRVNIGGRFFTGNSHPCFDGDVILVCEADAAARLFLKYQRGTAKEALALSPVHWQSSLARIFRLDTPSPAHFTPRSLTPGGMPGVKFLPGSKVKRGKWALTYTAEHREFKLTNGLEVYLANVSSAIPALTETVTLKNGIDLALNDFDATIDHGQEVYTVRVKK